MSLPCKRKTKRKSNPVKDIMDLTKLQIASTVGVITMESLPDTPRVPAMGLAKGFVGSSFGTMQTLGAGKAVLRSLEGLENIDKKRKR